MQTHKLKGRGSGRTFWPHVLMITISCSKFGILRALPSFAGVWSPCTDHMDFKATIQDRLDIEPELLDPEFRDVSSAFFLGISRWTTWAWWVRQARPDSVSSSAWRVAWDVLRRQGPQGLYRGTGLGGRSDATTMGWAYRHEKMHVSSRYCLGSWGESIHRDFVVELKVIRNYRQCLRCVCTWCFGGWQFQTMSVHVTISLVLILPGTIHLGMAEAFCRR